MIKTNLVIGLLALALFSTAQYRGWNLFNTSLPAGGGRGGGGVGAGIYHK